MTPKAVLAAGLASVFLGNGSASLADESAMRVVVELFTSQGCSACPPADALLARLAEHDNVLPLALHVDYWDYIGWPDSFARPEHTTRQKAYAHAFGSRMVYTPQMIVGGVDQIVGTKPMDVVELVMAHAERAPEMDLDLARSGDDLTISGSVPQQAAGPMVVQLVRFQPEASVHIKRGENAGRTLSYTNVVTDWQVVAEWSGAAPLALTTEVAGDGVIAVIVQQSGNGRILAAADLR